MITSLKVQGKGKGPWDRCNGFCGYYECNENQKENPYMCKRLNHKKSYLEIGVKSDKNDQYGHTYRIYPDKDGLYWLTQKDLKEALEQPKEKCKCSFAQSIVGDGCRYCQPQDYIDTLEITMKEMQEDYDKLFNEKATIWKIESHPRGWQGLSNDEIKEIYVDLYGDDIPQYTFAKALGQKLKEKNT